MGYIYIYINIKGALLGLAIPSPTTISPSGTRTGRTGARDIVSSTMRKKKQEQPLARHLEEDVVVVVVVVVVAVVVVVVV